MPRDLATPTAVLKFGGEVVAEDGRITAGLGEVAELVRAGWRFVLCHGGGPQANALGARLGLEVTKVAGQRVTDAATLALVTQVLAGEVGCRVVAAARAVGLRAVGLSAGTVLARRRPPVAVASEGGREVDYGFVGDVVSVEIELLEALWARSATPVLSSIGVGVGASEAAGSGIGELFNINADTVAAAVARRLAVDHLFLMTGVPGVLRERDDLASRIPRLDEGAARRAIAAGVITGGMIPKVEEALAALDAAGRPGARAVHILTADPGALAAEAREPGSCGTVLVGAEPTPC